MPPPTIQQTLDLALQHHRAGRLREAERLYRQILAQQRDHPEALHYLGVIAHQAGRNDLAVDLIRRAIGLRPNYAEAHGNLGMALKATGRIDDAIAEYRRAIALRPNYAEAHGNLGNALKDQGRLDDAIAAQRRAIDLNPNFAQAHGNLGNALRDKGQLDQAIAAFRRAVVLRPNDAEAHGRLGLALRDSGQLDDAIAAFRTCIALDPASAEAHSNLGIALRDKGQLDEAIAAFRQGLARKPDFAEAHNNLGVALRDKGQLDEAVAAFRQSLALRPGYAEAHNNLGVVLWGSGQIDEAVGAYRQAIALRPDYVEAHSNLVYALHFDPNCDARQIAEEHRRWSRQHAEPLRNSARGYPNDLGPDRRLRIGYVSPDFRAHPVGRFLMPLLDHRDRRQFEIFCYSDVLCPDWMTERARKQADVWRNVVGMTDEALSAAVRQDRIDILVDLAMHTSRNRLLMFARKPAPVQVTYLAYCSTTGLDAMDYRLTDAQLDPPGESEEDYSEKSIRLPDVYWCYEPVAGTPEVTPLPALAAGHVTFGCFNNFAKVSPEAISTWIRLLREAPSARLILHARQGDHRQRTLDRLKQQGIDPARLAFVGVLPGHDYIRQYHRIDIGLDPFPCAGGTTTCDALWMGVPVVTLAGRTAVGRSGVTLLHSVGLDDLVARTPEQYVELAVKLAGDLPRLAELRAGLRERMRQSPLTDAPKFARNVEATYRQMWRKHCEKARARD